MNKKYRLIQELTDEENTKLKKKIYKLEKGIKENKMEAIFLLLNENIQTLDRLLNNGYLTIDIIRDAYDTLEYYLIIDKNKKTTIKRVKELNKALNK